MLEVGIVLAIVGVTLGVAVTVAAAIDCCKRWINASARSDHGTTPSRRLMDILNEAEQAAYTEAYDRKSDCTADEVVMAVCAIMRSVWLADKDQDALLTEWGENIVSEWCRIVGSHDWTYDQCGYWGHKFCERCHTMQYPELGSLRCSEASKLTRNATEQEYSEMKKCGCRRCVEQTGRLHETGMILCPTCGNKRCPHAEDHRFRCTASNEPNQVGIMEEVADGLNVS